MSLPVDVVFARGSAIIGLPNGSQVRVVPGTHWPADDPLVRQRPDLFTRDSRFGMLYTEEKDEYNPDLFPPMDDDEFESASAAPGEKRSVRRRRSDEPVTL